MAVGFLFHKSDNNEETAAVQTVWQYSRARAHVARLHFVRVISGGFYTNTANSCDRPQGRKILTDRKMEIKSVVKSERNVAAAKFVYRQ